VHCVFDGLFSAEVVGEAVVADLAAVLSEQYMYGQVVGDVDCFPRRQISGCKDAASGARGVFDCKQLPRGRVAEGSHVECWW